MNLVILSRSLLPAGLGVSLLVTWALRASPQAIGQEKPAQPMAVALSDPSRPGTIKVSQALGGISVKGYEGSSILIDARPISIEPARDRKPPQPEVDSNRFAPALKGVEAEVEDNVVTIKTGLNGHFSDLAIRVPYLSTLKLIENQNGPIIVDGVQGEIEVSTVNGSIYLTNVSGTLLAHAVNGTVVAQISSVAPGKPIFISTVNGDIRLNLPQALKARIKLETLNGVIESQFEVVSDKDPPTLAAGGERKPGRSLPNPLGNAVAGTIHGGGPLLQVKSVNGSIYLRSDE